MLPRRRYGKVLEVGCGTGFFLLNLWQAGSVEEPFGCDISAGMLAGCAENARRLGCDPDLRVADAERLPYGDGTFDLVVGHAFLHHLPEPQSALAEAVRVLRPGGALFFAGEPTRAGDRLARAVGRVARAGFRAAARARPGLAGPPLPPPSTEEERVLRSLEFEVDLHTFEPEEVRRWAREAGLARTRVETEEFLASVFGWAVRTIEAEAAPGTLPEGWPSFAYRTWGALYRFDQAVLYGLVPKRRFYNLLLYGERPDG